MKILNNILESLDSYFNTLRYLGYKKQSDVNKLIIYNFIGELLTEDMRHFITESDYRNIEQALYCLYGNSCLIAYPKYINDDSLFGQHYTDNQSVVRITEDSNNRFTEDDCIRFKASDYNS